MSCEQWELRIADGEAGADMDQHLAECEDCRALAFDLRENAVGLAAMRDDLMPERRAPKRWPYVAAALAAAAMLTIALWPSDPGFVPPEPVASTPAPAPLKIVTIDELAPIPKPVALPVRTAPRPKPKPPAEPMLVKMLTDDPDVVIYWLIDNEGE